MASGLTHVDTDGHAHMVDVSAKDITRRRAVASGTVTMEPATLDAIEAGSLEKGDVLAVARVAGISGAKQTSTLIPLCHNIVIDRVGVEFELERRDGRGIVRIETEAIATGRTGVEMEALTACATAALALYDMCKAIDRGVVIGDIRLERKEGGKTGVWQRS